MQKPGVVPSYAEPAGSSVQAGVLARGERELNTVHRQTNIGGQAAPRPSVPIALFSRYASVSCPSVRTTSPVPAEGSRTGTHVEDEERC